MVGSVDGCFVLPENMMVGTNMRVDTTQVLSIIGSFPPWGATGERPEFHIKPSLEAPFIIVPRRYVLTSFNQRDT